MPTTNLIPLIAIVGPTAVGKTSLAVSIGPEMNAEVVSADSRQFYRYMDIGTAKPSPEEQQRVPHHLIDIAVPDDTIGLARFLKLARAAIADIHARGSLPFLVGGTGQYVRALLQGWQVPEIAPDPTLRAELENEAQADPQRLWERLMEIDPAAADFIDHRNLRRVIRALEVSIKSGRPFSEQRRRIPPPYRVLQIGLTMDRASLYERADARVVTMMGAGLLDEVKRLLAMGYDWQLPAMSSLGYKQFAPYFEKTATLDEVIERIQLDTHDFIRRQYSWFRPKAPDIHWLDATTDVVSQARVLAQSFLTQAP